MAEIERSRVKKAFSRHAEQYESLARVQKRVVDRFFELFMEQGVSPENLLDVGSGTGILINDIRRRLPHISITGVDLAFGMICCAKNRLSDAAMVKLVCGDAESLPFSDCCFDMVVSTSTYQWLSPLDESFKEVWRVLKPGGRFCFAFFGDKTLFELKNSYSTAVRHVNTCHADRLHQFPVSGEVQMALEAALFDKIVVFDELEVERYPDVYSLIRAVNGIGAGSAARRTETGLAGRSVMLKMIDIYRERYGTADVVPATYQVLYCAGSKLATDQSSD